MRETYIGLMRVIAAAARRGADRDALGQLLVVINSDDAPRLDQDVVDLLSELYVFVAFGYEPDRADRVDAIRNWGDFDRRLAALKPSSQAT